MDLPGFYSKTGQAIKYLFRLGHPSEHYPASMSTIFYIFIAKDKKVGWPTRLRSDEEFLPRIG